jgi:hypothetical protein
MHEILRAFGAGRRSSTAGFVAATREQIGTKRNTFDWNQNFNLARVAANVVPSPL